MSRFSKVFRRFLTSYLLILMIPSLAGHLSYRAAMDVSVSSSIESSLSTLKQSKEILERRLIEVEGFTKQLAINQDLNKLMIGKEAERPAQVYDLWKMARDLSTYSQTNDYLQNFYVYFHQSDVILTPGSVYYRPHHFYQIHHFDGLTYEDWKQDVLITSHTSDILPMRSFTRNKVPYKALALVQSLPLNSFNKPKATVVVLIEENKIASQLQVMSNQYGGWAFIKDNEGRTLVNSGIEMSAISELKGIPTGEDGDISRMEDGTLKLSIVSDLTGWVYTAGIPEQALLVKANRIKHVTWIVTSAALAAGLLAGLLFAYRNSVPIHRLLRVVKDHVGADTSKSRNEFDFLAGNFTTLITDNRKLEQELNEQLPLLQDAFIKRLLTGDFQSSQEMEAVSAQTGIELDHQPGYACLLRLSGYGGVNSEEIVQELRVGRYVIKQALKKLDDRILATDFGSDKLALLLPAGMTEEEGTGSSFDRICKEFLHDAYERYRLSMDAGIGGRFTSVRDISRSFEEAQQALAYAAPHKESRIIWFSEANREAAMYYYPLDSEQRMINVLRAGEAEEGKRLLNQLLERNFTERELSLDMRQQFVTELKGTLLKLMDQKDFTDAFAEQVRHAVGKIQPADDMTMLKKSIESVIDEICGYVDCRKTIREQETVQEVMDVIHKLYGMPDLSLYMIAEEVGKPEKYISSLFKEHQGENLFDVVERIRMNHAQHLLGDNQLTIDEIAGLVGYNSAHSFRRAFKRVCGVTPSVFRQSLH
ncbi:helix-turn-helix domain-containing protein [Paenibacillus lemnae]|uniref:Helix-turn-helix domain-containing protein n=1 Tax=Paenibacillus lemnae TaxID=1330551 RepID=A0A848MAK8_PAELE|nr:helix-turn-helix domain-containing protein [Paenibacillus lemnae]NMO97596.1 helix-turn-helix domain-containing protein [Paenibacillus lemnae]